MKTSRRRQFSEELIVPRAIVTAPWALHGGTPFQQASPIVDALISLIGVRYDTFNRTRFALAELSDRAICIVNCVIHIETAEGILNARHFCVTDVDDGRIGVSKGYQGGKNEK